MSRFFSCAGAQPSRNRKNGRAGARPSRRRMNFLMSRKNSSQLPKRSRPHHQIIPIANRPIIVLVTICTKDRQPWLATPEVHETLISVWKEATAWLVGRYVIMPNHIHLFASPCDETVSLEKWVRYWKSQFSKRHKNPNHRWQSGYWDKTLRSNESYDAKWEYVRNNPVRHGLVEKPERLALSRGIVHIGVVSRASRGS